MSVSAVPGDSRKRVVIIGGGVTGMVAAYELSKANASGAEIVVLEGSAKVGGWLASSQTDEGVLCEQGPRAFRGSGAGTYTLKLACELGLQEQLVPCDRAAARRFVYLDGRLQAATLWFMVRRVGVWNLFLEFLNWGHRAAVPADDESVADFFRRRFGEASVEVAQCLVGGVFAGNAQTLSLRAAFPAIHAMEKACGSLIWAGIKSTLGLYTAACPVQATDEVRAQQARASLFSFQSGMRTLPSRLRAALVDTSNVALRTNALVVGMSQRVADERLCVSLVTGEDVVCDHVISTISPYYLSPLAGKLCGKQAGGFDVSKALGSIPHANLVLVNVVGGAESVRIPKGCEGFGFLVPNGDILGLTMDSLTFPAQNAGVVYKDEPGAPVVLTVMIGGTRKDKQWLAKIDPVALAVEAAERYAGVVIDKERATFKVTQVRNGIPQYELGHTAKIAEASEVLAKKRVTMAGMAVLGPGVNDSLVSGLRAAQCVSSFVAA